MDSAEPTKPPFDPSLEYEDGEEDVVEPTKPPFDPSLEYEDGEEDAVAPVTAPVVTSEPTSEWTSGYGVTQPSFADKVLDMWASFKTSAGVGASDAIAGAAKTGADIDALTGNRISGAIESVTGLRPRELNKDVTEYLRERSRQIPVEQGADPALAESLPSQIGAGLGSFVPIVAAGGTAAPVVMAGMMGEQGRKEAEQAGASESDQDKSFYLNATVGALSEKLLGLPALLKSAKAAGIKPKTYLELAITTATQTLKSAPREATQEWIEQVAGNTIANKIVGYDAERGTFTGAGRAALVGGIIGAGVGGAVQIGQSGLPDAALVKNALVKIEAEKTIKDAEVVAAGLIEAGAPETARATLEEAKTDAQNFTELANKLPAIGAEAVENRLVELEKQFGPRAERVPTAEETLLLASQQPEPVAPAPIVEGFEPGTQVQHAFGSAEVIAPTESTKPGEVRIKLAGGRVFNVGTGAVSKPETRTPEQIADTERAIKTTTIEPVVPSIPEGTPPAEITAPAVETPVPAVETPVPAVEPPNVTAPAVETTVEREGREAAELKATQRAAAALEVPDTLQPVLAETGIIAEGKQENGALMFSDPAHGGTFVVNSDVTPQELREKIEQVKESRLGTPEMRVKAAAIKAAREARRAAASPVTSETTSETLAADRPLPTQEQEDEIHEELAATGFEFDADGQIYDIRHLINKPMPLAEAAATTEEAKFRQGVHDVHVYGRIPIAFEQLPANAQRIVFQIKGFDALREQQSATSEKPSVKLAKRLEEFKQLEKRLVEAGLIPAPPPAVLPPASSETLAADRPMPPPPKEPPSPEEVARAARLAAPRTAEQKHATMVEGGRALTETIRETGLVPSQRAMNKKMRNPAETKKLRTDMKAELAKNYPPAPLPEGATEITIKSKLVPGSNLPSVVGADGKAQERFSNNTNIEAERLGKKRVVVPADMVADHVNPAITLAKDKTTGEYYIYSVDVMLPDDRVEPIYSASQFETEWKKARQFEVAHAPVFLDPDKLQAVQDHINKEQADLGFEPLELDLEAYTEATEEDNPTFEPTEEDIDEPPDFNPNEISSETTWRDVTAKHLKDVIQTNVLDLRRWGVSDPNMPDRIGVALRAMARDKSIPYMQRLVSKLMSQAADWSKVPLVHNGKGMSSLAAGRYSATDSSVFGAPTGSTTALIQIRLSVEHRGGLAATILHEAMHHITLSKMTPWAQRNPHEQRAYNDIRALYHEALAETFDQEVGHRGTPEELVAFAQAQSGVKNKYARKGVYYGLSDPGNFLAEIVSNEMFQTHLANMRSEDGTVKNKFIARVMAAWRTLLAGKPVAPDSVLARAFESILDLTRAPLPSTSALAGKSQTIKEEREFAAGMERQIAKAIKEGKLDAVVRGKPFKIYDEADIIPVGSSENGGVMAPDLSFKAAENDDTAGHYTAMWDHILNNPKLNAAYDIAVAENPSIIEGFSGLYEFMANNGFVRVVGGGEGNAMFIEGKPTAAQRKSLINAAIEQKVGVLIWDLGGGRGERVLYDSGKVAKSEIDTAASMEPMEQLRRLAVNNGMTLEAAQGSTENMLRIFLNDKKVLVPEKLISTSETIAADAAEVDPAKAANGVKTWINGVAQKMAAGMKAEGSLPKKVFERWLAREGEVKAISRDIAYTSRKLYAALRDEYKIGKLEQFSQGYQKVPTEVITKMNDALLGKVPMDSLPESLRGPLVEMRAQIDALSQKFIDEGLATGDLELKFTEELGTYMTRSFRIFDDPKWAQKIPLEVRNRAKAFILSEMRADNPAATDEDANRRMESMLQDWREQGDKRGVKGSGRLGGQDFSTFIARKDLSPEILALLGEYTDPVTNYARSVTKMASLLASNRFLKDVLRQGKDTFLFEDGKQPEGFTALIAAEENAPMAPLNGLRTTPAIAEAFQEFGKAVAPGGIMFRSWMKVTALAKGSKTVGSLMTQVRNAEQFWFWAMNGHFNITPLREAVMSTAADIGLSNNPKWQTFYKNMLKVYVVGQSAKANELRDTLQDAVLSDLARENSALGRSGSPLVAGGAIDQNLWTAFVKAPIRAYQMSDDGGKVVGFMNERVRQSKMLGVELTDPTKLDWIPNAADTAAAKIITLTYPTYSMVPKWIQNLRRQPLFGPFMTFSYEAMRTTYHNLSFTVDYMRESWKPGANPEYGKAMAQRAGGQMAVLSTAGAVFTLGMRALLGMGPDDEEDARKLLPDWDKNAQLAFIGKRKGQFDYINLSYQNPYSYITDPLIAVQRSAAEGDVVLDVVVAGAAEFLEPFTNENILSAAVLDITRNKTATGREVYNPADTRDQKIRAVLARLYESVEPGTATRVRKKWIPAARGETRGNLKLNLNAEVTSEIIGLKVQTLDFKQALGYAARDFLREERSSQDIFRSVALREGTVASEEIVEAYSRAEGQRFQIWKDLHESAVAAIRQGITTTEIRSLLKARAVTAADTSKILHGTYVPFKPTEPMKKQLRKVLKRALPKLVSPYAGKSLADPPTNLSQTE